MKEPARLIIPVWGEPYATKLVSVTLPAILAPGNLVKLCDLFEVELVVVTESRLFESIRNSQSFQSAASLCKARLVSLDDLMTDLPGDYGVVLTYALFRGFTDLGPRMTETYLLFLNADFVLSDGSLDYLGRLMCQGKRVIHAPSFRVVLEDVWPRLQAQVDPESGTLRLTPRDMVKLALKNKHPTVKARTVNQRLCHQSWMDQYYWYVNEDTLIGYQWPVALVAIKPERVVTEPVLVWDYGFIPEAAPTAERHFIGDSDDFFMLEPQTRESGQAMIRLGWISLDDIARNLSMWTTREQRECGKELLTIHASDLPENLDRVVEESRTYMAEIYRRLSPRPLPHIGHSYLGPWFLGARARMQGVEPGSLQSDHPFPATVTLPARAAKPWNLGATTIGMLEAVYRRTFGFPPDVGKFHPLWPDTFAVTEKIDAWNKDEHSNILWVSFPDSLFHRLLGPRVDLAALLADISGPSITGAPFGACICELKLDDVANLNRLYARIRPFMRDDGRIVVSIVRQASMPVGAEGLLSRVVFPDIDRSEIHFYGTAFTGLFRTIYKRASRSFPTRPIARVLTLGVTLVLLAPFVRLANALAAVRDSAIFSPMWTSLIIEFTVVRGSSSEGNAI
jgi:hypothetical protein